MSLATQAAAQTAVQSLTTAYLRMKMKTFPSNQCCWPSVLHTLSTRCATRTRAHCRTASVWMLCRRRRTYSAFSLNSALCQSRLSRIVAAPCDIRPGAYSSARRDDQALWQRLLCCTFSSYESVRYASVAASIALVQVAVCLAPASQTVQFATIIQECADIT